jgi:hypothetical protein
MAQDLLLTPTSAAVACELDVGMVLRVMRSVIAGATSGREMWHWIAAVVILATGNETVLFGDFGACGKNGSLEEGSEEGYGADYDLGVRVRLARFVFQSRAKKTCRGREVTYADVEFDRTPKNQQS